LTDREPKRVPDRPAPLAVYAGRELLGTVAERAAFWFAYGADGRLLARCASRREALAAIDIQGGRDGG
jgi:hypothetical protein